MAPEGAVGAWCTASSDLIWDSGRWGRRRQVCRGERLWSLEWIKFTKNLCSLRIWSTTREASFKTSESPAQLSGNVVWVMSVWTMIIYLSLLWVLFMTYESGNVIQVQRRISGSSSQWLLGLTSHSGDIDKSHSCFIIEGNKYTAWLQFVQERWYVLRTAKRWMRTHKECWGMSPHSRTGVSSSALPGPSSQSQRVF